MKKIFIYFGLLLLTIPAISQITFEKVYSNSGESGANSVQQTTDGGYIVAGVNNKKMYLVKIDANGDTLWTKMFGNYSTAYSVQQTTDAGYIVVGVNNYNMYLVKTDANGDTLWTKMFGNNSNAFSVQQTTDGGYIVAGGNNLVKTDVNGDTIWTKMLQKYAIYSSVQQTTDGGYIVAGGNNYMYLAKTDVNGDTLWTKILKSIYNIYYSSVQQTTDGGYIVAGDNNLVKTDVNGDTLWTKIYDGSAYSVQQTTDGGYIVAGIENADIYLVKTDVNGDTLWTSTIGGGVSDVAKSVRETADGGYIVAGYTNSFGQVITGFLFTEDTIIPYKHLGTNFFLVKTDSVGKININNLLVCDNALMNFFEAPTIEICMITADSVNGNYVIVWEKAPPAWLTVNSIIYHYNIYKQKGNGDYELIGTVPYNDNSIFVDSTSNVYKKSERYKISLEDSCNKESASSLPHKSIHLLFGEGINGVWNLVWDVYEGFSYSYYVIYRGTSLSNMLPIDTIQKDFTTYTDLFPPAGIIYYQIEAVYPPGCKPSTGKSSTYIGARSNIGTNDTSFLKKFISMPVANFAADTVIICKGDTLLFNNFSVNTNYLSWYFQGGTPNTSSEKNPYIVYSDTGTFDASLTAMNSNGTHTETKQKYITVKDCLNDTGSVSLKNINTGFYYYCNIYPNPTDGSIHISLSKAENIETIIVYNQLGQAVYEESNKNCYKNNCKIELSNLENGVYSIRVQTSESTYLNRFTYLKK